MSCPEQLLSLEAWWHLKRAARPIPRRSDFTPEALRPWLGNIGVVAVERADDRLRFRVTLSGNRLDDYRGFGVTGQYVDTLQQGAVCSLQYFMACATQQRPVRFIHDNSGNSAIYRQMAKLLLPLGDAEGRVDRILISLYPLPANDAAMAGRRATA